MLLSNATYSAFKVYINMFLFPINQTHDFGIASALYYQISFMKFAGWFVSARMLEYL